MPPDKELELDLSPSYQPWVGELAAGPQNAQKHQGVATRVSDPAVNVPIFPGIPPRFPGMLVPEAIEEVFRACWELVLLSRTSLNSLGTPGFFQEFSSLSRNFHQLLMNSQIQGCFPNPWLHSLGDSFSESIAGQQSCETLRHLGHEKEGKSV